MELKQQARIFTQFLHERLGDRLVAVMLFGSVARDDATTHSDIDLLVVIKNLPPGRYVRRMVIDSIVAEALAAGCTAPINCHLRTPEEAKHISLFYYDFLTDGQILYEHNHFFEAIVAGVAEQIRRTGAVRKRWGRFYYWDLKPGAHADETFEIV